MLCFYTCLSVILVTGGGICIGGGLNSGGSASDGSVSRGSTSSGDRGCIQWGGGSLSRGRGWADPPFDTMEYGQQTGGTHPTGMHSCYLNVN